MMKKTTKMDSKTDDAAAAAAAAAVVAAVGVNQWSAYLLIKTKKNGLDSSCLL